MCFFALEILKFSCYNYFLFSNFVDVTRSKNNLANENLLYWNIIIILLYVHTMIKATHSRLILIQARKATKRFGTSDWCRKFVIEFEGEEGTYVNISLSRSSFVFIKTSELTYELIEPHNGLIFC